MTLPPLPDLPKPAYLRRLQRPDGGYSMVPAYTPGEMRDYARAAIAAHVPEAAFGNIAAVPAQPVLDCDIQPRPLAYPLTDYHRAGIDGPLHYTWQDKPHRLLYDLIAAVRYYAAPQAVPAPAGWSVTYDGKRASYIYADQETAEFEAQQVGGTARAVAVYLAAAPKEQPHE